MKKLTKSNDKVLAGVLGGIAEYFDADKTLVRLIGAAVIIFANIPGIILYIIAAIVMPEKSVMKKKNNDSVIEGEFYEKKK